MKREAIAVLLGLAVGLGLLDAAIRVVYRAALRALAPAA